MVYSAIRSVRRRFLVSSRQEPWTCQLSLLMADEALADNKDEGNTELATVEEKEGEEDK